MEQVIKNMDAESARLRAEGKTQMKTLRRNTTFYGMEATRLDVKRRELEGHLALLRAPDSFGCIPPLHPIRVRLRKIIWSASFDRFINSCIAISSLTLALERPGILSEERFFLDLTNTVGACYRHCSIAALQRCSRQRPPLQRCCLAPHFATAVAALQPWHPPLRSLQ